MTYTNPVNVAFSSYDKIDLGLDSGIEIDYPMNWEVVDYERPNSITFRSLPENSNDTGREYLRIDSSSSFPRSAIDSINVTNAFLPNLQFVEPPHNITLSNNSARENGVYLYR